MLGRVFPSDTGALRNQEIMKKTFLLFLLACLATGSSAIELDAKRAAVQAQFKSKAEPTAKDALWTSPTMFKVGVMDNGTPRDGYAMYVCEEIRDHGIRDSGLRVQIIDVVKLVRQNKWVTLGEASCK